MKDIKFVGNAKLYTKDLEELPSNFEDSAKPTSVIVGRRDELGKLHPGKSEIDLSGYMSRAAKGQRKEAEADLKRDLIDAGLIARHAGSRAALLLS
ncbi:MAG TPA: hypothetical protein VIN59_05115 [Alphaproteobacteria bacterium]